MQLVPVLRELGEPTARFSRRLDDVTGVARNDQQHVLQLSNGWSEAITAAVSTRNLHFFWSPLAGAYDSDGWVNLENLLRKWRLSPMALLDALYGLAARMARAMHSALTGPRIQRQAEPGDSEVGTSAAAIAMALPRGSTVMSLVDKLSTALLVGAEMADAVGPAALLHVIYAPSRASRMRSGCSHAEVTHEVGCKLKTRTGSDAWAARCH